MCSYLNNRRNFKLPKGNNSRFTTVLEATLIVELISLSRKEPERREIVLVFWNNISVPRVDDDIDILIEKVALGNGQRHCILLE